MAQAVDLSPVPPSAHHHEKLLVARVVRQAVADELLKDPQFGFSVALQVALEAGERIRTFGRGVVWVRQTDGRKPERRMSRENFGLAAQHGLNVKNPVLHGDVALGTFATVEPNRLARWSEGMIVWARNAAMMFATTPRVMNLAIGSRYLYTSE